MTIERSKGKARPTLPRSAELRPVRAVPDRTDSRDGHGRFARGNAGGRGRGWKHAIAKMLGRDVGDLADVATTVAEDAWRLFSVSIREMPHDGPNVRALVARKARHEALEGYWTARALAKLGTPEGDDAEAKATQHGQRAERLTVTALDVARVLASVEPRVPALPAKGSDPRAVWTQGMRDAIERRERQTAEALAHQDAPGEATDVEATPLPPDSESSSPPILSRANHDGEPPRTRVSERVVEAVEDERLERAATHVGRVLERDGVIGPQHSGDPLAPPAAKPSPLCPHRLNAKACPTCAMAAQQAQTEENRRRIRRDQ